MVREQFISAVPSELPPPEIDAKSSGSEGMPLFRLDCTQLPQSPVTILNPAQDPSFLERLRTLDQRFVRVEVLDVHAREPIYLVTCGDGSTLVARLRNEITRLDNALQKGRLKDISQLLHPEARILPKLNHPGLPKAFEKVDAESAFGPGYYLTLREFVPGQTLRELLDSRKASNSGPLTPAECLPIMRSLLEVLDYLHRPDKHPDITNPIIHRDIKPQNIVLLNDVNLSVKLIDFGAAANHGSDFSCTIASVGTLGYQAPEQLAGRGYPQSDLYSLAVTMYEAMTGINPGPVLTDQWVDHKPVRFPSSEAIPRPLLRLLDKMVQSDYKKRPNSAKEVLKVLSDPRILENNETFISRFVGDLKDLFSWAPSRATGMPPASQADFAPMVGIRGYLGPSCRSAELIELCLRDQYRPDYLTSRHPASTSLPKQPVTVIGKLFGHISGAVMRVLSGEYESADRIIKILGDSSNDYDRYCHVNSGRLDDALLDLFSVWRRWRAIPQPEMVRDLYQKAAISLLKFYHFNMFAFPVSAIAALRSAERCNHHISSSASVGSDNYKSEIIGMFSEICEHIKGFIKNHRWREDLYFGFKSNDAGREELTKKYLWTRRLGRLVVSYRGLELMAEMGYCDETGLKELKSLKWLARKALEEWLKPFSEVCFSELGLSAKYPWTPDLGEDNRCHTSKVLSLYIEELRKLAEETDVPVTSVEEALIESIYEKLELIEGQSSELRAVYGPSEEVKIESTQSDFGDCYRNQEGDLICKVRLFDSKNETPLHKRVEPFLSLVRSTEHKIFLDLSEFCLSVDRYYLSEFCRSVDRYWFVEELARLVDLLKGEINASSRELYFCGSKITRQGNPMGYDPKCYKGDCGAGFNSDLWPGPYSFRQNTPIHLSLLDTILHAHGVCIRTRNYPSKLSHPTD